MRRIISIISALVLTFALSPISLAQKADENDVVRCFNQMQKLTDQAKEAYEIGNYIDAANYSGVALDMLGNNFGRNSKEYVNSAIIHASYAVLAGEKKRAITIGKEALQIQRSLPNSGIMDYARIASILSDLLVQAESYQEAIVLAKEVHGIYSKTYGDNSLNVVPPMRILAQAYYHIEDYAKSVRYGESIVSIQKKKKESSADLVRSLLVLGDYYVANKQNDKAILAMNEAQSLAKETGSVELHLEVLERVPEKLKLQNGHSMAIIKANEDVVKQSIAIYGQNSRKSLQAIENLLYDCYELNQYDQSSRYSSLYIELVKKQISDNIMTASLSRQSSYWENYAFSLSTFIPFLAYNSKDTALNSQAYDALLISKSYLLNAEARMRGEVLSSNDSELKKAYEEMLQGVKDLNAIKELPYNERPVNESVVEKYIERKQAYLYSKTSSPFLFHSWTDIQQALKQGEAAVELAVVQDYSKEYKFEYVAYVVKPGISAPIQVPLFDLISWYDNSDPKVPDERMYNLVWKPLETVLNGVNCVYFSPTGKLWESPFEHSILSDSHLTLSSLEVHRMSSTAEILSRHEPVRNSNAYALFGGMRYNFTDKESITAIKRSRKRGSLDDISSSTLQEVSDIAKMLKQSGKVAVEYTGLKASEDNFKQLSGHSLTAIHIATHGFYWGNTTSSNVQNLAKTGEDPNFGSNDETLYKCGLLFSGAKNSLQGAECPFEENGILTGAEIASLNFYRTDMVVLSACQSGIGTTNVEGVWGLTRAFKRSGVSSLLTTLWSVDDDATCLFMTEFYKNWLSGKSKIESLKNAQQYLKEYEVDGQKIYSSPEYWAGFTLLDAIN